MSFVFLKYNDVLIYVFTKQSMPDLNFNNMINYYCSLILLLIRSNYLHYFEKKKRTETYFIESNKMWSEYFYVCQIKKKKMVLEALAYFKFLATFCVIYP